MRVLEQRLSKLGKRILALSTNQKKEMMKKERLIAENEKLKVRLFLGDGFRSEETSELIEDMAGFTYATVYENCGALLDYAINGHTDSRVWTWDAVMDEGDD